MQDLARALEQSLNDDEAIFSPDAPLPNVEVEEEEDSEVTEVAEEDTFLETKKVDTMLFLEEEDSEEETEGSSEAETEMNLEVETEENSEVETEKNLEVETEVNSEVEIEVADPTLMRDKDIIEEMMMNMFQEEEVQETSEVREVALEEVEDT